MSKLADQFWNAKQTAEQLGVSLATLSYWRANKRGPTAFQREHRFLYRRTEVARWLAEAEGAAARDAYVESVVAAAPELTAAQRDRISAALSGVAR